MRKQNLIEVSSLFRTDIARVLSASVPYNLNDQVYTKMQKLVKSWQAQIGLHRKMRELTRRR